MTREEQRAKLVEIMCIAEHDHMETRLGRTPAIKWEDAPESYRNMKREHKASILAALHGHYTINAVEVTEEMQLAGCSMLPETAGWADSKFCFEAMAAAGDLTGESS